MKKHLTYLLLPLIFLSAALKAKTGRVSGKLMDEAAQPVAYVTIALVRSGDSVIVSGTLSSAGTAFQSLSFLQLPFLSCSLVAKKLNIKLSVNDVSISASLIHPASLPVMTLAS